MERGEAWLRMLKRSDQLWLVEGRRLGLDARCMLSCREERARRSVVLLGLEKVVDEMRGEGDQVEQEHPRD